MINLKLPFWENGQKAERLRLSLQAWWVIVESWLMWPLQQMDIDTCTLKILDLIAWQRYIERFKDEPEWLYRLRVKYAFVNAKDAGSIAGFQRIFTRLGVGDVEILERQIGQDWDVIILKVSDEFLAQNQSLLDILIQMYGRTCRRYEWTVQGPLVMSIRIHDFHEDQQSFEAKI